MALLDNLIGLWHTNEGSGSTVADSSGNGNNGTISGAAWDSSGQKLGASCLSFDAVDDGVDCGNDTSLDITTEFTFFAWIKRNSIDEDSYIMHKSPSANTGGPVLYINSSNYLSFFLNNVGFIITSDSTITDTTNYHNLIVTRTASGNLYKMYIDGVFHKQVTNSNYPAILTLNFWLGHHTQGLGAKGDEFALWGRPLTDGGVSVGQTAGGEVAELWNGGAGIEIGAAASVGQIMHGKTLKSLTMGRLVI